MLTAIIRAKIECIYRQIMATHMYYNMTKLQRGKYSSHSDYYFDL